VVDKSHFEFREIDQVEWDIATGCRSHDEPEEEECVKLAGAGARTGKDTSIGVDSNVGPG